jgi:hypothetical protein
MAQTALRDIKPRIARTGLSLLSRYINPVSFEHLLNRTAGRDCRISAIAGHGR